MVKRKMQKIGKKYKSRGYKQANEVPLSRVAALGLLAKTLDTYSNRSGYIKPTNKLAVKRQELKDKWNSLKHKFRQSKRDPNILVEKTKHAIDSIEEKEGIPYEAQRLRKAGLLNIKQKKQQLLGAKKQKAITLLNMKISNSFLTTKKRKGGKSKWL